MSQLSEAFLVQAEVCADLGSQMYADLSARLADDLVAGGVSAIVLAAHANSGSGEAMPLRLLGSVHRLVLERRAGALAAFYPSVGGTWDPVGGWTAFCELLEQQPAPIAEWLDRPPQTNEVGRASALMGGMLGLSDEMRMPVRLFEIGASAGLNLLVDQFAFVDSAQRRFGSPATNAIVFENAWTGRELKPWPSLRVIERAGCDVMPIDPRSTEGRLSLTAYVWADQTARFERLRAALALAQETQVEVRQQSAADFVSQLTLAPGVTTVLWHSVMWQYLAPDEQRSIDHTIETLGGSATSDSPLVRLMFEPTGGSPEERGIVRQSWSGAPDDGDRSLVGTAPPHGVPCLWN